MLGRHHLLAFAVVAAVGSRAAVGSAQPGPPAAKQRALDLFAESDRHYKAGEFEQAVELLRQAYDLFPEPILLYNLARALEGMGDTRGAVEQYRRYLASATDLPDRGAIERRIETLDAQLAATDAKEPAAPAAPALTALPVRGGERRDDHAGGGHSVLPWVTVGVGVAVIGGGGALAYLASQRHDAAVAEPIQAEAKRLQDQAESYATTANVMFIAGSVVTIGGAVWALLDRRRHPRATAGARLQITPTSIGVAWSLE